MDMANVLSESQIEQIRQATEELLEKTGFHVGHDELLRRARRAGARLQTLVIDEGFGTQDGQGRERLVEAISAIRDDFEKIIVITHIDELKDAFPTRIDVWKTDEGSQVAIR